MNGLRVAAFLLGAVLAAVNAVCLFLPGVARTWARRFPRHVTAGWFLCAVDLLWAGWLLYHTPLGWFDAYKRHLFVLVPVAFVLVVTLMDELLAARALGGLFILAPAPLLAVARWHLSSWRLVMVVVAYLIAIQGIVLVLSPYQLRRMWNVLMASERSCRAWGMAGMALGLVFILLGIAVY